MKSCKIQKIETISKVEEGRLVFSVTIDLYVSPLDEEVFDLFTIRASSLSYFQWLPDSNEIIQHINGVLILKTYCMELIAREVTRIFDECNANGDLLDVYYCLTKYMEYEFGNEEIIEEMEKRKAQLPAIEEPEKQKKVYKVVSVELASGKPYADDCEYAYEVVNYVGHEIDGDSTYTRQYKIATVGWLEQQIEEKQIMYVKGISIMRYFDLQVLKDKGKDVFVEYV